MSAEEEIWEEEDDGIDVRAIQIGAFSCSHSSARLFHDETVSFAYPCLIYIVSHCSSCLFPTGDVEYAIPALAGDLTTAHPGPPRFIDQDGLYYDSNYYITTVDVKDKENAFVHDAMALKGMPDPANYLSYSDYEQALVEWKTAAEEALGNVVLPMPLGRYTFRPRLGRSARSTFSCAIFFHFFESLFGFNF